MDKSPIRILLLEDNPSHADLVEEALSNHKGLFALDHCTREEEFFAQLGRNIYDGILLDYFLGPIEAKDVLRRMQNEGQMVPVILMSGAYTPQIENSLRGMGVIGFIAKTQTSLKTLPMYVRRRFGKERQLYAESDDGNS